MLSRSKKKQLKLKERRGLKLFTVNQSQQTDIPQEETKSSTTTTTTTTEPTSITGQSVSTTVPTPSSPSPPATVHLESNDGRIFTVEVEVARLFGIVRTMLDDSIITAGVNEVEAVPLVHVSGPILELAVTWAKHHQKKNSLRPDQLKEEGGGDADSVVNSRGYHFDQGAYRGQPSLRSMYHVDPWDAQFLDALTPAKLQSLLEAANYLNIQQLLDSCCKMIARMIKNALGGPGGTEEVTSLMQIPVSPADEERRRKKCRSSEMQSSSFNTSTASIRNLTEPLHTARAHPPSSTLPVASTSGTSGTSSTIAKSTIKVKSEEDRGSIKQWVPLMGVFPNDIGKSIKNPSCSMCHPSTSAATTNQQLVGGVAVPSADVPLAPTPTVSAPPNS